MMLQMNINQNFDHSHTILSFFHTHTNRQRECTKIVIDIRLLGPLISEKQKVLQLKINEKDIMLESDTEINLLLEGYVLNHLVINNETCVTKGVRYINSSLFTIGELT